MRALFPKGILMQNGWINEYCNTYADIVGRIPNIVVDSTSTLAISKGMDIKARVQVH